MNHGMNDDPRYSIRGGKGIRAGLGVNGESRPASQANRISANQILTMQHSGGVVSKGNVISWDRRDYDRLERSEAMRSQRGLAMNHSTTTAVGAGTPGISSAKERAEARELIGVSTSTGSRRVNIGGEPPPPSWFGRNSLQHVGSKSALTEHVRGTRDSGKSVANGSKHTNTTLCLSVEDVALPTRFGGFSVKWRGDRGDIKEGEDAEIAIKQCRLVMVQNRRRRVEPANKRSRSAEER
ncbi:hypothetical protein EDD18DRAFT_1105869 [Armillaria luteobubalina]|uniref:Uncharacterized protein n=1 Tax=Armillaria luteobubalina TaxID=153913 RepID=A0AA39Q488_9AGAR|nr:hypothetical protein EDD18DRAFT_1105869 [Armillaria luteobubalina]